jgi:hypothetical protein
MADQLAPSTRHAFTHEGRMVYEWDQSLQEVNVYVQVPPGCRAKDLFCNVTSKRVSMGLHGNPPYLEHDLAAPAKTSECFWTLEDGTLHITLAKAQEGEPWPSVFVGHAAAVGEQQEDQQRLMLERFQVEHPGFDFSSATFNGQVPNPRTFMGGLRKDA